MYPENHRVSLQKLELWGGHECTVNRVGDRWFDQTPRTGHESRVEDLALFAQIGIRKLRYPALWERVSPDVPEQRDFRWTDERIPEIRRLGMQPILTLCHHGSGPHYTSLMDDSFAPGLARHAAAVAERYPWVEDYTPVNEPLTTARFSALYGYWYPHLKDERALWIALLNEIDATRLAMRAIRTVNPAARLIQTDDLGFCHATLPLKKQAAFQNERRWMGWDLLCGMVIPGHALWNRLVAFGLKDRLRAIADDPCPPDVIGVNHYLSGERLLDHRIDLHGDRGLADRDLGECDGHLYVDVDAVRSLPDEVIGLGSIVEQAWQRYGRPVAITECHHGTTREEQARWFIETWEKAEDLRARGVDLRAVTAWSLLGSHDWNRMVTRFIGHDEPGVFDTRGGSPRPTLMTTVIKALALGQRPTGPGLSVPGWWRDERRRLLAEGAPAFEMKAGPRDVNSPAPLMIIAGNPVLIDLTVHACERRGLHYLIAHDGPETAIRTVRPWAVLDLRDQTDMAGSERVTQTCSRMGIVATIFSNNVADQPRREAGLLAVTTHGMFTEDDGSLAARILDALDDGRQLEAATDVCWSGVYGPSVIDGVLDLMLDGVTGQIHFASFEEWSEAEFARALAVVADRDPDLIVQAGGEPSEAPRSDENVSYAPPTESMLERFVIDRRNLRRLRTAQLVQGESRSEMAAAE